MTPLELWLFTACAVLYSTNGVIVATVAARNAGGLPLGLAIAVVALWPYYVVKAILEN